MFAKAGCAMMLLLLCLSATWLRLTTPPETASSENSRVSAITGVTWDVERGTMHVMIDSVNVVDAQMVYSHSVDGLQFTSLDGRGVPSRSTGVMVSWAFETRPEWIIRLRPGERRSKNVRLGIIEMETLGHHGLEARTLLRNFSFEFGHTYRVRTNWGDTWLGKFGVIEADGTTHPYVLRADEVFLEAGESDWFEFKVPPRRFFTGLTKLSRLPSPSRRPAKKLFDVLEEGKGE